jgi:toxin ParE1/3/4
MKLFWTTVARAHLRGIYNYIALHSEKYAQRTVDGITRKATQIKSFPMSGRRVPEYNTEQIREVIHLPYRIIYYIRPDNIEILAVIHSSQSISPPQEQ